MHDEPAFIDFETFYSQEYSLRKLMTSEYILHPEFQITGLGIAIGDDEPCWLTGDPLYLRAALEEYDLRHRLVVAHNTMFDGAILEWKLGIRPAKYFCTMMGARPVYAMRVKSMSLDALTRHLGVPHPFKNTEVLASVKGVRLEDMPLRRRGVLGRYCCDDVSLMRYLYRDLDGKLPDSERDHIDITIKKFTQPKLKLDRKVLLRRQQELTRERAAMLAESGVSKTTIMSNQKFAAALEAQGVEPPMKTSPTTGKPTFAFSKTDREFLNLQQSKDAKVVKMVKARLALKSTIEPTRIERMLRLSERTRWLPAPMLYYGAHTGRWSGLDSINLQNLTRKSALREAIVAPPGYVVLAGDLSQIEARVLAWLAKCRSLLRQFAAGEDVYALFASKVYGRPILKDRDDTERFVGKTAILGLGYGLGWMLFHDTMLRAGIDMSKPLAQRVVYTYRDVYHEIPALWAVLEQVITYALSLPGSLRVFGPLTVTHEFIQLPNQMTLEYPGLKLRGCYGGPGWQYEHPKTGVKTLYGGKLTENIVQALARIILSDAELRLARHGLRAALTVHDELVYVVREEHAPAIAKAVEKSLTAPVPWMPGLPLACEVKWGRSYGDCK